MKTNTPELKEAILYKKYSLFIVIISIPFMLVGYILRDSSSFASQVISYGIVGFVIGLVTLLIWALKIKRLQNQ